jgi:hypothetical protein
VIEVNELADQIRRRRAGLAYALLGIVVAAGMTVRAQSRSATLSVSVVVVPRCSVSAAWPTVSLHCSGRAERSARATVAGRAGQPQVRVGHPERLDLNWRGSQPVATLLLIDF